MSKYDAIFEAMVAKNLVSYEAGDVDAAAEMYDEHGVVVDKKNGKSYFGTAEIKLMLDGFIKMGKCEFKITRKAIHEVGDNRFLAETDFVSKFVESGVEMKASSQLLYEKKGDAWKCVYEGYEMQ